MLCHLLTCSAFLLVALMGLTYFKRYRMEIDLCDLRLPEYQLPSGYRLVPWRRSLLRCHAETKYRCFAAEIDAHVFPCLGEHSGCLRLMKEISRKPGFLPGATWLAAYQESDDEAVDYCGTVQGVRDKNGIGAVQNLGTTPEHRGQGLGSCLMMKSLDGFQRAGLRKAFLEVTTQNDGAVQLYERLGFRTVKTVYKAVEMACV